MYVRTYMISCMFASVWYKLFVEQLQVGTPLLPCVSETTEIM